MTRWIGAMAVAIGAVAGVSAQQTATGIFGFTPASEAAHLAENARLGQEGLRVLATARKDFDAVEASTPAADLLALVADGLELMSLVGIVDPPRPSARASIEKATAAGIRVRMITGDHAVTAGAIARQLGIEGEVLTGAQFASMDDDSVLAQIDHGRGHRPGHAGGQGPPGRPAQATGTHRGDDRRRGQRRPRTSRRPTSASPWGSPAPRSPRTRPSWC